MPKQESTALEDYNTMIGQLREAGSSVSKLISDGRKIRQLVYLPGVPENGTATFKQLYEQRIMFDLAFAKIDLVNGEVTAHSRCIDNKEYVRHLCSLLDTLLASYSEEDKMRFKNKQGNYKEALVGLIFGITHKVKDFESNWNKHDHSPETHHNIVVRCIEGAKLTKTGRVTEPVAKTAFKAVQEEVRNTRSTKTGKEDRQDKIKKNILRAEKITDLLHGTPPTKEGDKWDLGDASNGFTKYLKKRLEEPGHYVDHACPEMSTYRPDYKEIPRGDEIRPSVKQHLSKPDCDGRRHVVWWLSHLFSPEFEEKLWKDSLDKQAFMKGKGGRRESFMRIFTDAHTDLHMVIGKYHAYEAARGDHLTQLDEDLLAAARYLCDLQRDFLVDRLIEEGEIDEDDPVDLEDIVTPASVKIGQSIVNKIKDCCYKSHSDAGPSVNRPDDEEWSERHPLATVWEQQTLTYCSQDLPNGQVKIIWFDRKGTNVLELITDGPGWHWQSPMMQAYLKHKVSQYEKDDPHRIGRRSKRLIVSFREAYDPEIDPSYYDKRLHLAARKVPRRLNIYRATGQGGYRIRNVIKKLRDKRYNFDDDKDEDEDDENDEDEQDDNGDDDEGNVTPDEEDDETWLAQKITKRYDLQSKGCADKFGRISVERFEEHNIERPGLLFQSYEPLDFFGGNRTLVTELYKKGYLVQMSYPPDTTCKEGYSVPSIQCIQDGEFPIVGADYRQEVLTDDLGLNVNDRCHDPMNKTDDQGLEEPGMCLFREYKNMHDRSVRAYIDNAKRYYEEYYKHWKAGDYDAAAAVSLFVDDKKWMRYPLCVGGSGASTTAKGTYAPTVKGAKSNENYATVYATQKSDQVMHGVWSKFTEQKRIVPVFFNPATYFAKDNDRKLKKSDRPNFLGFFYFCWYFFGTDPDLDVEKMLDTAREFNISDLSTLSFQYSGNYRFYLLPAFDSEMNSTMMRRQLSGNNHQYGVVDIPSECDVRLSARVLQRHRVECVEFGHNTMTIDKLIQLWVESDSFDEFVHRRPTLTDINGGSTTNNNSSTTAACVTGAVGEFVKEEEKITKMASAIDILDAGAYNQFAGCYRAIGASIEKEKDGKGNEVCGPIPNENEVAPGLTGAYRVNPRPMTNRGDDVGTTLFTDSVYYHGFLPNEEFRMMFDKIGDGDECDRRKDKISEILAMAVVNRLTGSRNGFRVWRQMFQGRGDEAETALPKLEELDDWLLFCLCTTSADKDYSIRHLVNGQFKKEIPQWTQNLRGLRAIIRNMRGEIRELVNSFYDLDQEPITSDGGTIWRPDYATCKNMLVNKLIEWSESDDSLEIKWLVQGVLQDVGEVVQLPCGEVTVETLEFGTGANYGRDLLNNYLHHLYQADDDDDDDEDDNVTIDDSRPYSKDVTDQEWTDFFLPYEKQEIAQEKAGTVTADDVPPEDGNDPDVEADDDPVESEDPNYDADGESVLTDDEGQDVDADDETVASDEDVDADDETVASDDEDISANANENFDSSDEHSSTSSPRRKRRKRRSRQKEQNLPRKRPRKKGALPTNKKNSAKKKFRSDVRKEVKRKVRREGSWKLSSKQCAVILLNVLRKNRERYDNGSFFNLYWDESIEDFRHIRSKRRLNLVDAEHLLCKAYICYIQTTASRYLSERPEFTKAYCYPSTRLQSLWKETTEGTRRWKLRENMLILLERYEFLYHNNLLKIQVPEFSKYDNEMRPRS